LYALKGWRTWGVSWRRLAWCGSCPPCLAKLELFTYGHGAPPVEWPPFIPPSLKTLRIRADDYRPGVLRALPGMLGASGAALERLEVRLSSLTDDDGLVHVAQALRCCSPTLKGFKLSSSGGVGLLPVKLADVLAGVSACRELEAIVLPYTETEVEPLFPPGTAFGRLTHLKIPGQRREHPPDAGMMGLWELMASGGLPALAKLSVRFEDEWGAEEVRSRVAPALEAVAGTLTHLKLVTSSDESCTNEVKMGYELGVAVGKLRRLKDLALALSEDGRVYHAFAQGLAASGADRPLPLLWRVGVDCALSENAELVVSLLLPSVRVFRASPFDDTRSALLVACGLRQAGYKHAWAVECESEVEVAARAIAPQCRLAEFEDHLLDEIIDRLP
jgi:hypothetical protein